jgi:hypothetical protein
VRDKVIGGWRKLHYVELHDIYCSSDTYLNDKIKSDEMGRICSMCGTEEKCLQAGEALKK